MGCGDFSVGIMGYVGLMGCGDVMSCDGLVGFGDFMRYDDLAGCGSPGAPQRQRARTRAMRETWKQEALKLSPVGARMPLKCCQPLKPRSGPMGGRSATQGLPRPCVARRPHSAAGPLRAAATAWAVAIS